MTKYNTKDLGKAISKRTKIRLKVESMSIDYVGELDFDLLIDEFEKACEEVGKEGFRLRFMKKENKE